MEQNQHVWWIIVILIKNSINFIKIPQTCFIILIKNSINFIKILQFCLWFIISKTTVKVCEFLKAKNRHHWILFGSRLVTMNNYLCNNLYVRVLQYVDSKNIFNLYVRVFQYVENKNIFNTTMHAAILMLWALKSLNVWYY